MAFKVPPPKKHSVMMDFLPVTLLISIHLHLFQFVYYRFNSIMLNVV